MEVTLTSKCQFTLPARVRNHLHVHEGDKLDIHIKEDGEVVIRAKSGDWRQLIGILHQEGVAPVTDEQINEALESGVVEAYEEKQKRYHLKKRP
jgi:AbrB family looped-hinge helix DNA binding protein